MRKNSVFFLISLIPGIFSSCANYNSNTNDPSAYLGAVTDLSDSNFGPAFQIIQTYCVSCHGYMSSLTSSQKWVNTQKVIKGNPDASPLIQSLKNAGGDMPIGPTLTNDEYLTLRAWIENIP